MQPPLGALHSSVGAIERGSASPARLQGALRAQPALQHRPRGGEARRGALLLRRGCAAAAYRPAASPPAILPPPSFSLSQWLQLYQLFGKYGAIRQIRVGHTKDTRGTAYVVYEDIFDAKNAVDHLSGFNVQVGVLKGSGGSERRAWGTPSQPFLLRRTAAAGCFARAAGGECVMHFSAPPLTLTPRARPPPSRPQNRYLIILYYNPQRHSKKLGLKEQEAELRRMQEQHGVDGEQHGRHAKQ